jgi:hypothetical protein
MKIGDKVQYTEYGIEGAKGVIVRKAFYVRYELPTGRIVESFALPEHLKPLDKETKE